jgi:hypothetical protein
MRNVISYDELPEEALLIFSSRQLSYLDEFLFVRVVPDDVEDIDVGPIECFYGGQRMATWDGTRWNKERPAGNSDADEKNVKR